MTVPQQTKSCTYNAPNTQCVKMKGQRAQSLTYVLRHIETPFPTFTLMNYQLYNQIEMEIHQMTNTCSWWSFFKRCFSSETHFKNWKVSSLLFWRHTPKGKLIENIKKMLRNILDKYKKHYGNIGNTLYWLC